MYINYQNMTLEIQSGLNRSMHIFIILTRHANSFQITYFNILKIFSSI